MHQRTGPIAERAVKYDCQSEIDLRCSNDDASGDSASGASDRSPDSVHFTPVIAAVGLIVTVVEAFDVLWLAGALAEHQEEDHDAED